MANAKTEEIREEGERLYRLILPLLVKVPERKSGPWSVERFKTEMSIEYLRLWRDGRVPGLGEFTKLRHAQKGTLMSDTFAEVKDLAHFCATAHGRVLVTGLGLGLCVRMLLMRDAVKQITVVERDPHIVSLVAPSYRDPRVKIVRADAHTWVPDRGTSFDYAWHDIWYTSPDVLEVTALAMHYREWMSAQGRHHCWGRNSTSNEAALRHIMQLQLRPSNEIKFYLDTELYRVKKKGDALIVYALRDSRWVRLALGDGQRAGVEHARVVKHANDNGLLAMLI